MEKLCILKDIVSSLHKYMGFDVFTMNKQGVGTRQWLSVTRVNAASWVGSCSAPSQAPASAWIFFITTDSVKRKPLQLTEIIPRYQIPRSLKSPQLTPALNLECHSKLVSIRNNLYRNRNCFRLYKKPFVSVFSLLYRNSEFQCFGYLSETSRQF